MNETAVLIICGIVLVLSAVLVFQPYYLKQGLISLPHPEDYIAHFLTCFCSILFFYALWHSYTLAILITIAAALYKELIIDSKLSGLDMVNNAAGIIFAILLLLVCNKQPP